MWRDFTRTIGPPCELLRVGLVLIRRQRPNNFGTLQQVLLSCDLFQFGMQARL